MPARIAPVSRLCTASIQAERVFATPPLTVQLPSDEVELSLIDSRFHGNCILASVRTHPTRRGHTVRCHSAALLCRHSEAQETTHTRPPPTRRHGQHATRP